MFPRNGRPKLSDNLVRILLLDDHGLFREGLARLLNSEPGFVVLGQCATIDEALALTALEAPDLILLDYDLGGEVGTELLGSLAVIKPMPRVLIVTAGMTASSIQKALNAGASGVVPKHSGPEKLIAAIRDVMKPQSEGRVAESWTAPRWPDRQPQQVLQERPLTARQSKALHAVLDGLTNREIARTMNVSESSVKAVLQELFEKAGVRTRSQLIRVAIEKHTTDWIRDDLGST